MKTALITGIGGQDGSYLAELLLNHGYEAVSLGEAVLRAETAAMSAVAVIAHFWNK